jgi:hypothetical protein
MLTKREQRQRSRADKYRKLKEAMYSEPESAPECFVLIIENGKEKTVPEGYRPNIDTVLYVLVPKTSRKRKAPAFKAAPEPVKKTETATEPAPVFEMETVPEPVKARRLLEPDAFTFDWKANDEELFMDHTAFDYDEFD